VQVNTSGIVLVVRHAGALQKQRSPLAFASEPCLNKITPEFYVGPLPSIKSTPLSPMPVPRAIGAQLFAARHPQRGAAVDRVF